MIYKYIYKTPDLFSNILLNSDGEYLTGLWFEGSKCAAKHSVNCVEKALPIFQDTARWLDLYFDGQIPDFTPSCRLAALTPFRRDVVDIMCSIPFGEIITYSEIARQIAQKRGLEKMSAQAVGGAVGWNPICIIIPCHRVVGAKGNLAGYSGGLQNKIALLAHEKNDMTRFFIP